MTKTLALHTIMSILKEGSLPVELQSWFLSGISVMPEEDVEKLAAIFQEHTDKAGAVVRFTKAKADAAKANDLDAIAKIIDQEYDYIVNA